MRGSAYTYLFGFLGRGLDKRCNRSKIGVMLILLAVLVGLGLAVQALAVVGTVVFVRRAMSSMRQFIEPTAENELSPLAQITRAMGQDFAKCIIIQLKQSLSAPATQLVRQENAINQEMTEAAIGEQSPGISALLGILPKNVQKRVLGNPAAAMALVGMLGRMGGGAPGANGNGGGNTHKSSVQLRLQNLR